MDPTAEAAIGTGDDVFAAGDLGITQDAVGNQLTVVYNRIPCIAGDEQDLNPGEPAARLFREPSSVEARQSNVGEQQVHFGVMFDDRRRRGCLARLERRGRPRAATT
jgi:hypothetical protein